MKKNKINQDFLKKWLAADPDDRLNMTSDFSLDELRKLNFILERLAESVVCRLIIEHPIIAQGKEILN